MAFSRQARPRRGPGDNSLDTWDERHNPLVCANNIIHPYLRVRLMKMV